MAGRPVCSLQPDKRLVPEVSNLLDSVNWKPTPIQIAAMEPLLSGNDALLVAPTGSGKTEAAVIPLASNALRGAGSLYRYSMSLPSVH